MAPLLHLLDLLEDAANRNIGSGITVYQSGSLSSPARCITYRDLLEQASSLATAIQSHPAFIHGKPVLLLLPAQWDSILYFWAILLAGGIPALCGPLAINQDRRENQLKALSLLLEMPLCITRVNEISQLGDVATHGLIVYTVESLSQDLQTLRQPVPVPASTQNCPGGSTAVLMLTSGSTGDSKAVRLTHTQILSSLAGKASVRPLPAGRPHFNWVGVDHVAALTEVHLLAMFLGVGQVHAPAADLAETPTLFLDLLSRHGVSRTFAPNFFLARLVAAVEAIEGKEQAGVDGRWDLTFITSLVSGGEANVMEIATAVSALLGRFGARSGALTPAFGMTETCAGMIYNLDFPGSDLRRGRQFASVGKCMEGVEMRVTIPHPSSAGSRTLAGPDQRGDLEVRGPAVFAGYYRNPAADEAAFTSDGWFRTGDLGSIDDEGNLTLAGRTGDTVNINGIKVPAAQLQSDLERAVGSGRVIRIVWFPCRAPRAETEGITVAFVPLSRPASAKDVADIKSDLERACLFATGAVPLVFAVRSEELLPQSTLGKVPRSRMREMFEAGYFDDAVQETKVIAARHRETAHARYMEDDCSEEELAILEDVKAVLGSRLGSASPPFGPQTQWFELGINSLDLIRLKRQLELRTGSDIPMATLMAYPTARVLSAALGALQNHFDSGSPSSSSSLSRSHASPASSTSSIPHPIHAPYDPVVTLRATGPNTPLWLVHPGVGEVLVFLSLASRIHSRPVHALRARGFDSTPPFASIPEAVETYLAAILRTQPEGPYAVAGYSYGAMLAFEVAKALEAGGRSVAFLASFNLPPHIRGRMRQLDWGACLLHLALFLGLVGEARVGADLADAGFRGLPRDEAAARVLAASEEGRLDELGLSAAGLVRWATVAYGLQSMARDYEPTGKVKTAIDVFHAEPLREVAASRREWVEGKLGQWAEFSEGRVRMHAVEGAHYTMIGPDFVEGFAESLNRVLRESKV